MAQVPTPTPDPGASIDAFVKAALQTYRSKLLDLSSRNPLINFRHSEKARSHIRVVNEIPEILFKKLEAGKQLSFDPIAEPMLIAPDESTPMFETALRRFRREDKDYGEQLALLGPNPSDRQKRKLDRFLRDRVREELGLAKFEVATDVRRRAIELGINPEYSLPKKNGQTAKHFNDLKIQTLFFRDDLAKKLGALRDAAKVLLHDAGFNALYVAFGCVEYYETTTSNEKRIAPLVFYPVELDRELVDGEYRYFIRATTEDVEVNVALAELLKTQLSLELPKWIEPEDDSDPLEQYFTAVEKLIAGRPDWKLQRYVTLGLFTFSTLVMYKDLDPQRWPIGSSLDKHNILRTLIAGAESRGSHYAEDFKEDVLGDSDALLVTEADSSQHSAILDVLRGKSCVIQGPPGTGKSQTITNIISAAINAGKSVLFVAEKMAALEVVHKRLKAAGLEAFCFEVHSTKTSKLAIVESLAGRLDYEGPRPQHQRVQSNLEAIERARKDLIYYVQKANEKAGVTGLTVQEILLGSAKRELEAVSLPATVLAARLPNPLGLTQHQRSQMAAAAETLENQSKPLKSFGDLAQHPWRGLQNCELTEFDHRELGSRLAKWESTLKQVVAICQTVSEEVGTQLPSCLRDLSGFVSGIESVQSPDPAVDEVLYAALARSDSRKKLEETIGILEAILNRRQELMKYSEAPDKTIGVGGSVLLKIQDELAHLGMSQARVADLVAVEEQVFRQCAELDRCRLVANELIDIGAAQTDGMGSLGAAVVALDLLRSLPRELLMMRTSAILAEENAALLVHWAGKCAGLVKRRQVLEGKFDMSALPSVAELTRFVYALRTTNPITALFNADCREAKKIFKFVSKVEDVRPSRLQLAAEFSECARYLKEESEFVNNQELKTASGKHFAQLGTAFPSLVQVNQWAREVDMRSAPFGADGEHIKNFLYTGDIGKLDRLLGVDVGDGLSALRSVISAHSSDRPLSLANLLSRQDSRKEAIRRNRAQLAECGLRPDCCISDINAVTALVADVNSKCDAFRNDPKIAALVPGEISGAIAKLNGLKSTLQHANRIASAKVPPELKPWLLAKLPNLDQLKRRVIRITAAVEEERSARDQFDEFARLDFKLWAGKESAEDVSLPDLLRKSSYVRGNEGALRDYVSFLLAEDEACESALGPVIKAFLDEGTDYLNLVRAAELVFFRSAAEQILNSDPRLKRHSGATHEQLRKQYQKLDREYLELRREFLASRLIQRLVPGGTSVGKAASLTELALVERIAGQTRPRVTVRELLRRAGRAIQALKPCWMMSPMSVAQFLEPGYLKFDLVVMDEASQIRPQEALGAIARGSQLVVVGDQMQLPPSPFFQKLSVDGTLDADDDFADEKEDSVLETAAGRFYPPRRLKWHYRSEHGGLISFSNREFYQGDLIVFPSPNHDHPDYGVKLVSAAGVYGSGLNEIEGRAVVKAAEEFMEMNPGLSLGIVAVNSKQSEFIREEMDRLFAANPRTESYRAKWDEGLESFFVKNLENVQGDERDVIFISTVYGPDANGSFHQRFGPINGLYGHRRLNVLFTRAKKKVMLFTSMKPEEIKDEGKHLGVRVLKTYIQYARDGHALAPDSAGGECDSEFEQWVLNLLRAKGFEGVPQLGFSGYKIDIAVRHPDKPGVFLCGIECDGATYHSAPSVRERDRLRQEILEKLGWKIYRIWSTDWFRNPKLQSTQLMSHLDNLVKMTNSQ